MAADRLDETAHRLLMSAHLAAGEPSRALAVYDTLRAELSTELGVDPAPETRQAYLAVLHEQAIPAPAGGRRAIASPAVGPSPAAPSRPDLVGRGAELAP